MEKAAQNSFKNCLLDFSASDCLLYNVDFNRNRRFERIFRTKSTKPSFESTLASILELQEKIEKR